MQFGKPIKAFQAVKMRLAEMATELEAARRLVHYGAWRDDQGLPSRKEAAMAKLFASETGLEVCDGAARVLASYGYAEEYPVERHLRDVRFTLIGGGTSEILKLDHRQGDLRMSRARARSASWASTATTWGPRSSAAR